MENFDFKKIILSYFIVTLIMLIYLTYNNYILEQELLLTKQQIVDVLEINKLLKLQVVEMSAQPLKPASISQEMYVGQNIIFGTVLVLLCVGVGYLCSNTVPFHLMEALVRKEISVDNQIVAEAQKVMFEKQILKFSNLQNMQTEKLNLLLEKANRVIDNQQIFFNMFSTSEGVFMRSTDVIDSTITNTESITTVVNGLI
jgi:hypothetical protein